MTEDSTTSAASTPVEPSPLVELPPEPDELPEIMSVRLWGELELRAAQLGVAAARFDLARSSFVVHQREHGFVDEKGRAKSIREGREGRWTAPR